MQNLVTFKYYFILKVVQRRIWWQSHGFFVTALRSFRVKFFKR